MANYSAACRTNYFKVNNVAKFLKAMEPIPNIIVDTDDNISYYILGDDPDGGGWPNWVYNEETEEEYEIDLMAIVSTFLSVNEVAIFVEAGSEKLRYVIGCAVAVNHKGEQRVINLSDIYDIAKAELTDEPDSVTVAEY